MVCCLHVTVLGKVMPCLAVTADALGLSHCVLQIGTNAQVHKCIMYVPAQLLAQIRGHDQAGVSMQEFYTNPLSGRHRHRQATLQQNQSSSDPQLHLHQSGFTLARGHLDPLMNCSGCREYTTVEALAEDYKSGALHPKDLKDALAAALNKILEPVRQHFEQDANAKALLKKVRSYATTR